jgi:hypothetical protein
MPLNGQTLLAGVLVGPIFGAAQFSLRADKNAGIAAR